MAGEKSVRLSILGNNADAKAKIQEVDDKAEALKQSNPELSIGIDTAAASEKIRIFREELRATKTEAEEPLVLTADDVQAVQRLDALKVRVDELKAARAKITLDADDKEAVAKVAAIDAQLDALSHKTSDPKVGLTGIPKALAEVAALDLALDKLNEKKSFISAAKGVGGAASELGSSLIVPTAIAAAAGPGVAAFGLLSAGALGLTSALVPAVLGLGLFGAVVKSGITQVETADAANKKLSGGLGELQTSVKGASSSWTGFLNSALKNGGASTIAKAVNLIPLALSKVAPLLKPVEGALDGIIGKLGSGLKSSGFSDFMNVMSFEAPKAITHFAGILGHLGSIVFKTVDAFQGFGQNMLGGLDKLLGKADAGTDSGLMKFMNWIRSNGPGVAKMLENLGTTLKGLGGAFANMGKLDLPAFEAIATLLAKIASHPIGADALVGLVILFKLAGVVGPMIRLVLAFKELSEVINLTKIAAIGLDAVPIVLVISLIILAIVLLITHWNTVKSVAAKVWHDILVVIDAVFGWIKKNWPLLAGILLGPIALAVGEIITHWHAVETGCKVAFDAVVSFFKGLPGRILSAVGHLDDLLRNAGMDVVMGLVHGIEGAFGDVTSVISRLTGLIPSTFKHLLGIASPSKVMKTLAEEVPNGIVAGFSGSTSQIQSAANKLTAAVKTAFSDSLISESKYSGLTNYINNDTNKLKTLAAQRTAITNQIKTADAYAASVSSAASGTATLSTIGGNLTGSGGIVTGSGLIGGLQSGLAQINKFSADITRLRKAGLDSNLLNQIIQMGPVDGDQYATAFLNGGGAQIGKANSLEKSITQASSNLGASAANAMYDSGKAAGQGFLTGLQGQEKAISAVMSKLGASMVSTIKRDLDIHSPSRVMAAIGVNITDGLTLGITGGSTSAVKASQNLVSAIANPHVSSRSLGASAGSTGTLQLEWVGGAATDSDVMTYLKKNIRIRGGNPAVLGR